MHVVYVCKVVKFKFVQVGEKKTFFEIKKIQIHSEQTTKIIVLSEERPTGKNILQLGKKEERGKTFILRR
jgi:hypothetical protein